jgi:hypothetical protein
MHTPRRDASGKVQFSGSFPSIYNVTSPNPTSKVNLFHSSLFLYSIRLFSALPSESATGSRHRFVRGLLRVLVRAVPGYDPGLARASGQDDLFFNFFRSTSP